MIYSKKEIAVHAISLSIFFRRRTKRSLEGSQCLRRGLERPQRPISLRLRNPDGNSSATDREPLEVLRALFRATSIAPRRSPQRPSQLPQVPIFAALATYPSVGDVATSFTKSVKPGTSTLGLHPEAFNIMCEYPKTMDVPLRFRPRIL